MYANELFSHDQILVDFGYNVPRDPINKFQQKHLFEIRPLFP